MTHVDITRRLMMQAAPPGAKVISDQVMDRLRGLTADLLAHQPDQDDPLPRYLAIQDRSIPFGEPTSPWPCVTGGWSSPAAAAVSAPSCCDSCGSTV